VDVCPTGSLAERGLKYESLPDEEAKTICPLCSMGCELDVWLKDGRIVSTSPSSKGSVNHGQACVKGRFLIKDVVYSSQRILFPLIKKNGEFEEVNWDEALDFVTQKLKEFKGSEIALIESSQLACEDGFVARKFASDVLKTKNVDTRSIFSPYEDYHSAAKKSGSPTALNFNIKDISEADTIFLSGSDIVRSHPIIWLEVLKAVKNGAKLIVVSPVEYLLNRFVWRWLRIKPGSESLLFGFLAKFLLEDSEAKKKLDIAGSDGFVKSLEKIRTSDIVKLTGVDENSLKQVSGLLANEGPIVFLFGAGIAQSPSDATNASAIRNLAYLSGSKLLPLGLEFNDRGLFELTDLSTEWKITKDNILKKLSDGIIKGLYIVGSTTLPKTKKTEFLVIQSSFLDENSKNADVLLPATTFAETEGVYVNVEGRIQMSKRVIDPLGDAKPDWWIFSQLARKKKIKGFDYKNPADILKEIRQIFPGFEKASSASLEKGKEIFIKEEQKATTGLSPMKFEPAGVDTSKAYPFKMILSSSQDCYRNLSLSLENRGFAVIQNSRWIRMNPQDADKLGFRDEDLIVVESSKGKMEAVLKVSEALPRGLVESQLLWNEDARYSGYSLVFPLSKGSYPQTPIPVKIKRGK
jgi:predicted molibdopterin-dependent oxidoreductase YjgC